VTAELFDAVAQTPAWHALAASVAKGGVLSCAGVAEHAQPFAVALLRRLLPDRMILVVTEDPAAQERFYHDLTTWLIPGPEGTRGRHADQGSLQATAAVPGMFCYPEWEVAPNESRLPTADTLSDRLKTLMALGVVRPARPQPPLVIATATAIIERTFSPEELASRCRVLRRGDDIDPLDLIEWLEEQAYEPEAQVTQKGELAMRGGIVDVFPLASDWPVRIEFFGNTIDSIRFFDPQTQISRERADEVWISPGGELGILRRLVAGQKNADIGPEGLEHVDGGGTGSTGNRVAASEGSGGPAGARVGTLAAYLAAGSIVILCEPQRLVDRIRGGPTANATNPLIADWDAVMAELGLRGIVRLEFSQTGSFGEPALDLGLESIEVFRPDTDRQPDPVLAEAQHREFLSQIHRWLRQGHAVHAFFNNPGEQQQFVEMWRDAGFDRGANTGSEQSMVAVGSGLAEAGLRLHAGSLGGGFACSEGHVVVVTDGEVFGRYKVHRPRRLKTRAVTSGSRMIETSVSDLEEGDYVVHVQHGIGRFVGLERISSWSSVNHLADRVAGEECLVIEYAPRREGEPPPRLHVPVSQIHLVTKYIGAGKGRPPLNKLGGTRWRRAKDAAMNAARDLAADLLAVQAARASQPGFAYPADCPWQRDFENAFPFEETPDQLRAIDETKQDMCTPRPMDRLICGDAGFGKTEVAIRAAFKAVLAGKQVAVLVPTTVLAHQHFNTFSSRMSGYPVRIELLSRFRSRAEQQRVLRDLAAGSVDIVIGTHRLLQRDVVFKDLGLVVIDEEQRFGVTHKERLKQLRHLVDVLTLTATPIPRTLYLALAGVRDMSSIETPPQDRVPVETIVAPYSDQLVRDAIVREMRRGGQVFYLHNRIQDIESVALRLRMLVPEAKIGVGHGQMSSAQLERTMTRFVSGEIDVLLSTTIVESGIDIPNANTIIIDRADRFGLSDLYQLRGRVGRYKHQAYAYLLIPRHAALLEDARKRIAAIKQFTKPGSGFKIAMRDLEIRGAGNILGPEQSGHITAVGFELYCQLLKQSIAALKGEQPAHRIDVNLRLDFLDAAPSAASPVAAKRRRSARQDEFEIPPDLGVEVPRDTAVWIERYETVPDLGDDEPSVPVRRAAATLPLSYVSEPKHRLEFYRKLAQATTEAEIDALRAVLRDRFGPLPPACDLLLLSAALKPLAAKAGVSSVETRGDRLMLLRGNDYIMIDGRLPRLTRRSPKARLHEIRKYLISIARSSADNLTADGEKQTSPFAVGKSGQKTIASKRNRRNQD
jgi:transcription-repair coupling factor (superfamily II helicase)